MKASGYLIVRLGLIWLSVAFACHAMDFTALPRDGRTMIKYRQSPNPNKVYISELYSPSGVQVLLDSPAEHVHHHVLCCGWSKVVKCFNKNSLQGKLDWVFNKYCADTRTLIER